MLGASIGRGLIVYQLARSSQKGLTRIEMGRSTFKHASSPSFIPLVASSLRYFFILESPLEVNISRLMGLERYDSDDDDEGDMRNVYTFAWKPQASVVPALLCIVRTCALRFAMNALDAGGLGGGGRGGRAT